MKTKLIIIILISAVLVSCAARQTATFHRPTIKPPEVFRGAEKNTAAEVASIGDLKWFEVFKDEELQRLMRVALENNYDLRSAMVRVEIARANVGITRSNQFPTIAANTNVTTLRNSTSGSFPLPAGFDQNRNFGNVALNLLSFEADIWGRLRHATDAARADMLAVDENRKAVTTTLVSDVASAYFSLLELDMELEIAQRTLTTRQDSLQLIKMRERGGLATRLEVRQGEELVQSAEQAIPGIEQSIEQTENQISLLLGDSPGPIARGRLLAEQEQPPSVPAGLPSALLERRPDIRSAEQSLAAANASVVLPTDQPHRPAGFSERSIREAFHRPRQCVAVRSASVATDLQRRPHSIERGAGHRSRTTSVATVRRNHTNRLPRSVGRAGSVSEGSRDSRDAGTAFDNAPG